MAWRTVTYESIDIRDGMLHEIFCSDHMVVATKPQEGKKTPGSAHKFYGVEKGRGPVSFLTTDSLAEDLNPGLLPILVRIQWKGKIPIKSGKQMFNVFACEKFVPEKGETFPAWTQQSAFEGQNNKDLPEEEELPEAGPNPIQ